MEWTDEAIVLGVRPFGEHSAILEALTRHHGRHLGLLRSASSKRTRGVLEAGNRLAVQWRARLDQQLGNFGVEIASSRAALFFDDGLKLSGLLAACAVCSTTLPEREGHERVFSSLDGLLQYMTLVDSPRWISAFIRFELVLLEDLGFGLDLERCAVTGEKDGLLYVSPKTGRAVTLAGAGAYADRLLVLPEFLLAGDECESVSALQAGMRLTEHFLTRVLLEAHGQELPASRQRFSEKVSDLA